MTLDLRDALASTRFGFGLSPRRGQPVAGGLIAGLQQPDKASELHPTPSFAEAREAIVAYHALRGDKKEGGDKTAIEAASKRLDEYSRRSIEAAILRAIDSGQGFRERLIHFWADHFALRTNGPSEAYLGSYLFEAIGANLTGRFADLLTATAQHPLMLFYLDQGSSVGPNSRVGERRGLGLNENYARELLELHTLGVDGSYGQGDVRQLAELLTGMSFSNKTGFSFVARRAEPGAETLLGKSYGGEKARLADIHAAFEDISVHPDTARHMARKLAVHFVSDTPDPDLVAGIERTWIDTGGALVPVYSALLDHPAAWSEVPGKVKRPFDFLVSSIRALGIDGAALVASAPNALRRYVTSEMKIMGQPPFTPPGPDGWPEDDAAWITPVGLATRIRWAMNTPGRMLESLPDPVAFANDALGPLATARLRWAASVSETRAQGVGLVLASPEFNRR